MSHVHTRIMFIASVAAGLVAAGAGVSAESFPARPIRIVVGVAPGTAPDVVARTLGQVMERSLGQPVVVENRPGAGGTLATTAVAGAAPDGHTLNVSGCSGDSIVHAYLASGRAPLVPFKDLTPVGRLMRDHWLVVVSSESGVATIQQLRDQARNRGDGVPFPSQGEGSSPHLQGERLARTLGMKSLHVPYKESPINDLVAGRLGFAVQSSASVAELVRSGRLKALAVLSSDRLAALPDVPTAAEAGLPNHLYNGGVCLWAPGATPLPVLVRLNEALGAAAGNADVRSRFESLGVEPVIANLEVTARYVADFMADNDRLREAVLGKGR
ncbi:MAG: tripartite tricarboxylate transporter substrate binding protein [Burkholderiaceae bacterium]